jgi:hypothetical protein
VFRAPERRLCNGSWRCPEDTVSFYRKIGWRVAPGWHGFRVRTRTSMEQCSAEQIMAAQCSKSALWSICDTLRFYLSEGAMRKWRRASLWACPSQ